MRIIFALLFLTSCVSREQVEGQLWFHDALPPNICKEYPFLQQYGIFRRIDCKKFFNPDRCSNGEEDYEAVLPYCSPRIIEFKAAEDQYVQKWLNKLGRPKKK